MPFFRLVLVLIVLGGPVCPDVSAHEARGTWRVFRMQPAPWVDDAAQLAPSAIALGARLEFAQDALRGPAALACAQPRYHDLPVPAPGLFQGGLPDPERQARDLGFAPDTIPSLRIDCDNASFDVHFADADTLLLALDNRIYSASRAAGALAPHGSPEAAVQALLETHFDGHRGFLAQAWAGKREALDAELASAIDAYRAWLDTGYPKDHVPPIDGDPLTDSQEYPTRFAVRTARVQDDTATVDVDFADAWIGKRLVYTLRQRDGRWLLSDVRYPHGDSFLDILRARSI